MIQLEDFVQQVRRQLIVSCQALPGEPLFGADIMAKMALAAQQGGAKAIRANGPADIAAFPALLLIFGAYGLITMPIENAVSRWRENMADDYALQSTGKNRAFASAFTRLANQNLGEVDPEKWVVWMFYSHPPLGERIAKANNWKV